MEKAVFINGRTFKVEYDDSNIVDLAIKTGWNSLFFSEEDSFFVEINNEDYAIYLANEGTVEISYKEQLLNGEDDMDKIRKLIISGEIKEAEIVQDNNFFATTCYNDDGTVIDTFPYYLKAESFKELVEDLSNYLVALEDDED